MGWGAAQAYYEENSDWLDSVEDAYDVLYPSRADAPKNKATCPLCGRGMKSYAALRDHLRNYHRNAKGRKALAELDAPY